MTAHRTGSADLLAILGALNTAAATGVVTDADQMMAYVKQLVTELQVVDALIDTNQDLLDGTTATPTAYRTERGVPQVAATTLDLAQAAGPYDLFTASAFVFGLEGANYYSGNVYDILVVPTEMTNLQAIDKHQRNMRAANAN